MSSQSSRLDDELRFLVGAYREAGWLQSLGAGDEDVMQAVISAVSPVWGWPPIMSLEETLLLADRERTWSDDIECDLAEGSGVYTVVVSELCRLLGAPIDPRGVLEDWATVPGSVTITVRSLSPIVVLRVPATAEVLHPKVVEEINHAFRGQAARLWFYDNGGQRAVITRATPEERQELESRTEVRLLDRPPRWWAEWVAPEGTLVSRMEREAPVPPSPVVRLAPLGSGASRVAYAFELPPVRGQLAAVGRCRGADAEAYLAWTRANFATRAALTRGFLEAAGAPPAATDPADPDGLVDLAEFVLRWFAWAVGHLYGVEWSRDLVHLEGFVRSHADDGTLMSFVSVDPQGFLMRKNLDRQQGRPQPVYVFPARVSTVGALIDGLAHDLGFLVAERAGRTRPDLHWQTSRRATGPGRAGTPEGVPVFEPAVQYSALTARHTCPFHPSLVFLYGAFAPPEAETWNTGSRWALWDVYQMLVTGQPSARSLQP